MFDQSYQGLPPVSSPETVPGQQQQPQHQQDGHAPRDDVSGYTPIPPSSFHEMNNAAPNCTSAVEEDGYPLRSRPGSAQQDEQQQSRSIQLRVLQASPLACRLKDGTIQRIESLNLKKERTILKDVAEKHQRRRKQQQQQQQLDVDLSFDIATLDSVGDYLMNNDTDNKTSSHIHHSNGSNYGRNKDDDTTARILHLSCHGTPGYFALEDSTGTGGTEGLNVQVLKRWLATASILRRTPDLIVLSACQSRFLGDACARYGQVPHVICAAASDDDDDEGEDLHEEYSMEFTKVLYRQLFSGATVRQAFDAASLQASAYKHFKGQTGFCLLPEDGNHNVVLSTNIKSSTNPSVALPGPPLWNNDQQQTNFQNNSTDENTNNSSRENIERSETQLHHTAAVRYNGGLYFGGKGTGNNVNVSPVHYCSPTVSPNSPVRNKIGRTSSPKVLLKRSLPPEMSSLSPPPSPREQRDRNWIPSPPKQIEAASSATNQQRRIEKELLAQNPPEFYVRHDLEMYNVIQAIGAARIVWVSGCDGVGKRALVQASCSYFKDRREMNGVEEVFWSSQCVDDAGNISKQFSGLIDALQNVVREDGRSILIVVDAKRLPDGGSMLSQHLQHFIETDSTVKLLVIHDEQDREDLRIGQYPCVELNLSVDKLSLESTVKLFGTFCQYVFSHECPGIMCPETLWRFLAPETPIIGGSSRTSQQQRLNPQQQPFSQFSLNSSSSTGSYVPSSLESESSMELPKRHQVIFRLLGDGFPRQVIKAAKAMTRADFDKIIFLGKFKELDGTDCGSHNGLLRFQVDVARAIVSSIRKGMYDQSSKLQLKYDCISLVKEDMKSLMTLRNDLLQIQRDIAKSRKQRDVHRVMHLFKEQQKLWKLLQVEVDAISNTTNPFQITKPEILDKCHSKQTIIESALVHVQNILVDVALQTHLADESARNGHETNDTTRMLKDAERLLLEAKLGNLKPSSVPKTNTAPPPTLASYVGKHRLSSDSIVGSQKDIHIAASLIQKQVRRHNARRKVEWLRVFRDLAERRRIRTRKREISYANHRKSHTSLLTIVEERGCRLQDRQDSKGRRRAPVRSTQENDRSKLHFYFRSVNVPDKVFVPVKEGRREDPKVLTKHEKSRRHIIQRRHRPGLRVKVPAARRHAAEHPISERIQMIRQQKKKVEEDPTDVATTTTVASTIVTSPSMSSTPSTLGFSSDSTKKKTDGKSVFRPFSNWKSPLEFFSDNSQSSEKSLAASRSKDSSLILPEKLPQTPNSISGSDHGRPASSIMLFSQSFSDSSLDLSLDISERTVPTETVRFSCDRQSSLGSKDSFWWKLGPDIEEEEDIDTYGASRNNTGDNVSRQRQNRRQYRPRGNNGKSARRHFRGGRKLTGDQDCDCHVGDRRWDTGCAPSSRIMTMLPMPSTAVV